MRSRIDAPPLEGRVALSFTSITPRWRAAIAVVVALAVHRAPVAGADTHGTWSQLAITGSPLQNGAYAAIVDPVNDRKILFGGDQCHNQCFSNAVSALALGTSTWSVLSPTGTAPPARFLPIAMYDGSRRRMVMIGGTFVSDPDPWALAMPAGGATSWQKLTTFTPPAQRYGSLAVYDAANDRMLLFGGRITQGNGATNELWSLSFVDDSWELLSPAGHAFTPDECAAPLGVYDGARDRLIVLMAGATWELSGLSTTPTWNLLNTLPLSYSFGPMMLDPIENRVLSLGASTCVMSMPLVGPPVWNPITLDGDFPPGIDGPVFDLARDRVVVERGSNVRFGIPHVTSALNLHPGAHVSVPSSEGLTLRLEAPSPNPSRGEIACGFALPAPTPATLAIFDVTGRRVTSVSVGTLGAGIHRIDLTRGRPLPRASIPWCSRRPDGAPHGDSW